MTDKMARKLNVDDFDMASEMFYASPDGKAELERVHADINALPDGSLTLTPPVDDDQHARRRSNEDEDPL